MDSTLDGCMWLHQGQIQKAGWVTTNHIALTTTVVRKWPAWKGSTHLMWHRVGWENHLNHFHCKLKFPLFFTKAIGCYEGGQGDEHVPITK